jgi:DNA-directed RNA polymerase subunit alpha
MNTLTCIENYTNKDQTNYGCFLIEPLEIGQGITIGNALRRTLLSDLTGFAITGVRINNLKHEFAIIEGVREDTLEILLNLKEITFKPSFQFQKNLTKIKGFINVKGPTIVNAGMLNLPPEKVKIINPNQYICTIVDNSELYLEIDLEKGKGYRLTEENRKQNISEKLIPNYPSTLLIDSIFMPVKKMNYKVKLIHDSVGNIKESLTVEIVTNGSITPKRSIQEATKILLNLFYPLLLTKDFLTISSELSKTFYEKELIQKI